MMRPQQYLSLMLLAMLALVASAGCGTLGIGEPTATPRPFDRYTAQDVFRVFAQAGLEVQNPEKAEGAIGRDAPTDFRDRYLFEIPRIAPAGGQIIVFATPAQLQEWQGYIEHLRADSDTRRDVIYVYVKDNIMLQLNASLTTQEATSYSEALNSLS